MPSAEEVLDSFSGCAEVSVSVIEALEALETRRQELGSFRPRALARAALAAASTSQPRRQVLSAVSEHLAATDLGRFEPADLAMLAWALAAAGHRDVPSMTAIGCQIAERAWEFSTEDLAKTLHSFAELGLSHQEMMATVSMEVMWKIDQFSAASLAQVAESCAKLGCCKEPMFDWLAARVIGRKEDYTPEDLSAVVWSFAEASIKHPELAVVVASEAARVGLAAEDVEMGRVVWALEKLAAPGHGVAQPLFLEPVEP